MKAKILFMLLTLIFTVMKVNGQAHNMRPGSWCKFVKKNARDESESARCLACEAKSKKEQAAKDAENNRRNDAIIAKAEAEKKAADNLRLEKLRLAREEEQRRKDKEITDKIARENAIKRYKEIAARGIVKSNVKGNSQDINLSNIDCFKDDNRKVYGFKIGEEEVLTFPYDSKAMNIDKIAGSNLFIVDVWTTPNKYGYSYLIDYTGKKITADGIDKSDYRIGVDTQSKLVHLYKKISTEATEKIASRSNEGLGNFHKSSESALADVEAYERPGWAMRGEETVCYDTRYTFDFSGSLLEKQNGYTVRIIN